MISKRQSNVPATAALTLLFVVALSAFVVLTATDLVDQMTTSFSGDLGSAVVTGRYAHDWDENPVAYIPESKGIRSLLRPAANWDENPVAYIPESTGIRLSRKPTANWDENPVSYIPESTFSGSAGK